MHAEMLKIVINLKYVAMVISRSECDAWEDELSNLKHEVWFFSII